MSYNGLDDLLAEFREFRGKMTNLAENLNKSDDVLWDKINNMDKRYDRHCISTENRITKLEGMYKDLERRRKESRDYSKWIWGLVMAMIGQAITLLGIIVTLL